MSAPKHTPGPWRINKHSATTVENENGRSIATCGGYYNNQDENIHKESEANTKLIAAAPQLLEALQFCKSVIEKQGIIEASERLAFDKAEFAIKKATE